MKLTIYLLVDTVFDAGLFETTSHFIRRTLQTIVGPWKVLIGVDWTRKTKVQSMFGIVRTRKTWHCAQHLEIQTRQYFQLYAHR